MELRRGGFTVVELLVAMLVLAVAIVTMAGLMTQTRRMQGLAYSRAELTTLGESKLEELRAAAVAVSTPPASLTAGGSLTADVAGKSDETTSASGRRYRRRWLVAAGPEGSVQVTLRVMPSRSSLHELSQLDFNTIILIGE